MGRGGRKTSLLTEAEQVMSLVRACPHSGCYYATNIKGDLAKHQATQHPKVKSQEPSHNNRHQTLVILPEDVCPACLGADVPCAACDEDQR